MRIAYLNFRPSSGVYKKILGQARAARKLGLDMDFFIITDLKYRPEDNLKILPIRWPRNFFSRKVVINFFSFKTMMDSMGELPHEAIILRYPGSGDLFLGRFLRLYGGRFITEHHAVMVQELKILEEGVLNPLRIYLENRQSSRFLSRARGIIGVTEEIRDYYLKRSGRDLPTSVISNGIEVESVPPHENNPFRGGELNVLFVSSTFYPGHGLDRLLRGLLEYRGRIPVNLLLAGRVYRKGELDLLNELTRKGIGVRSLGFLDGKELDDLYRSAHIAVSTLAVSRENCRQGCMLKTREYTARGIPFIYAYEDLDIDPDVDFALRLPDEDRPIEIDRLLSFAADLAKRKDVGVRMREYARTRLDWMVKMRRMDEFARSIFLNGVRPNGPWQ